METETTENIDLEHRVLIVDINKKQAHNLKYILDGLYITDVTDSVEKAIDYIKHNEELPSVIIITDDFTTATDFLSFENEGLDSPDLCTFIKESDDIDISTIPILTLVKKDDKFYHSKLFNAGASDVILLPYDMLDLFSRIELQLTQSLEKRRLAESMDNMIQDIKVRSRKNVDFRTKLFAKHRDTVLVYEEKIKRLRDMIISKKQELETIKISLDDVKRENLELANELKYIKSRQKIPVKVEKKNSLDMISESDLDNIENLFAFLNKEYLFEENLIKKISLNILKNNIDFSSIDNFSFIQNINSLLKRFVKLELDEVAKTIEDSAIQEKWNIHLETLVEYIIKVAMHKFLFFIIIDLLEKIGEKDENAIRFLKFYDGRIELSQDGTRYQKPLIGEKDGAWNMISMIQVINQRSNGSRILKEQREHIRKVNLDLQNLEKKIYLIIEDDGILVEELKKKRPFNEKIIIIEGILQDKKNALDSRECSLISEIGNKLDSAESLQMSYEKISNTKDLLMSKYEKQIAYYKPTEEKFAKVALSFAQVVLKVKIIH